MKKLFLILITTPFIGFSQYLERKHYHIERTQKAPIIDGKMEDDCWKNKALGTNFVCKEPDNGKPIPKEFRTEWRAVYDNKSVYFIIKMYDPYPDSILKQLSIRDDLEKTNTDQIGIWINPYNDGQTDFNFSVSAAGVQRDAKYSSEDIDNNWDMVWESDVTFDSEGWIAEFKIPYSALRFPKTEIQTWGLNIKRGIRRYREWYTWSFIDMRKENIAIQTGQLHGFENIKPPLRLSFMPYLSNYSSLYEEEIQNQFNGGLDLKYGVNESFTLDMTLIPDFGQVAFDNQVLNLSPFEVQYDEKRPFFTEGTEVLEKGGLFYSRRISDNLVNATKVTGRNQNNFGVGVLNAITGANEETGDLLSNYNVFAIDQSFNKNSSLTFTNTNVQRRNNEGREANVWGIKMALQDAKSKYQFNWKVNQSQVLENRISDNGYAANFQLAKISGKLRYSIEQNIESESYNPNDLGFLYNSNEFNISSNISYRIINPSKLFINYKSSIEFEYNQLYSPRRFTEFDLKFSQVATFKNYLTWGLYAKIQPVKEHDYFEARAGLDQIFMKSEYYGARTFFSSDYRKKFALDASINAGIHPLNNGNKFGYRISPRIRFNDKLFASYVFSTEKKVNNTGYTLTYNNMPVFATRDIEFITNVLEAQYVMSNKMSAKIKFRHHWEQVKNHSFHGLNSEGFLTTSNYLGEHNVNFNAWNIDLTYSWWFAPGSELSIVWKNAILNQGTDIINHYKDNIEILFDNPQENSLSLKVRYYLDYQYLKRK